MTGDAEVSQKRTKRMRVVAGILMAENAVRPYLLRYPGILLDLNSLSRYQLGQITWGELLMEIRRIRPDLRKEVKGTLKKLKRKRGKGRKERNEATDEVLILVLNTIILVQQALSAALKRKYKPAFRLTEKICHNLEAIAVQGSDTVVDRNFDPIYGDSAAITGRHLRVWFEEAFRINAEQELEEPAKAA
jgi:hypothetical protein